MSIAVLTQVYDEMRRLAIAGSVTAGGDFRLKKLIPSLEQAGAKAPVFAKVAQAVKTLVEGTEQTSASALLELCTLVNAVLYTQGETGLAGAWAEIETNDLGPQTSQVSAQRSQAPAGSAHDHRFRSTGNHQGFVRTRRVPRPAPGEARAGRHR